MWETTLRNIIYNIWPMILIITVILVSIRIVYFNQTKEKIILYEELLKYSFIIYIISLFYVVTFQDVSWSTSNFIPFKEMFRYKLFSTLFFKNVVGNMLMFLPFGFFVSYFLKLNKTKIIFFLSLIVSLTIETTQLIIGRVFDVDDIMLNIIGGLVGYFIYRVLHNIKDKLPPLLKNNYFYNIIILMFIGFILLYLYKIMGV